MSEEQPLEAVTLMVPFIAPKLTFTKLVVRELVVAETVALVGTVQ